MDMFVFPGELFPPCLPKLEKDEVSKSSCSTFEDFGAKPVVVTTFVLLLFLDKLYLMTFLKIFYLINV